MNYSPWLAQLNFTRKTKVLVGDNRVDVLVIGGGIAGVTTAYYLLKNTNFNVGLVEATRIAHGATGHNAGQIVGYFERPFTDIVEEYGLDLALAGQNNLHEAWDLIDDIFVKENLQTPYSKLTGYAGVTTWEQAELFLEKKLLRESHGIHTSSALISIEALASRPISARFSGIFQPVSQEEIWKVLETNNQNYFAAFGTRKGVVNSAQFCEEVLDKLDLEYSDRLKIWEHSPISEVFLEQDHAISHGQGGRIFSDRVVLCTNGFEHIKLTNRHGNNIENKFRENVVGCVGYMAGYLEEKTREPIATSYIKGDLYADSTVEAEPYFYLTRRNYKLNDNQEYSLICVGGPEMEIDDKTKYVPQTSIDPQHYKDISNFLIQDFKFVPKTIDFKFQWSGLMGYTKNGLRMIGPEPENPVMLYNLGCNGVGILSSVFGSWKISQFLLNKVVTKSIFDPV